MTLEHLLSESLNLRATDIHLHSCLNGMTIQRRIAGKLSSTHYKQNSSNLINRIKVLANLETSETKKTQEGQFLFYSDGEQVPVRVSIIATTKGEKAALRLLPNKSLRPIPKLGMDSSQQHSLLNAIKKLSGLCLVCGATGAGKTTTLYSCLAQLNNGERSIFTIEDPAEYPVEGAFQCEPNVKIGQGAQSILRSFLRQDPDVIMIGELRDTESASLAVSAALTGHLVLATVHANSAIDVIHRFKHWGVDYFSFASALNIIVHQRMTYINELPVPRFNLLSPSWSTMPSGYEAMHTHNNIWQRDGVTITEKHGAAADALV
ncbi:GspE/PulE family protein [Marinomonas balearica]|uniref:General secretion pathway protein E n=1 Tax=Marinomonas balearica TaxID=491947 RepID=A0A4R6M654_9GAMM|nr:ATPase, T2SS/T4P/T4SS family [Marinomonas balearica]TDO96851.1 general secretion pathway protein E [Marinomonas balearica]